MISKIRVCHRTNNKDKIKKQLISKWFLSSKHVFHTILGPGSYNNVVEYWLSLQDNYNIDSEVPFFIIEEQNINKRNSENYLWQSGLFALEIMTPGTLCELKLKEQFVVHLFKEILPIINSHQVDFPSSSLLTSYKPEAHWKKLKITVSVIYLVKYFKDSLCGTLLGLLFYFFNEIAGAELYN